MDPSKARGHLADKLHGTIMGLTVVLIFPLGAMSRILLHNVLSSRNLLRVHVGCQLLGLAMLLTGLGLGAWTAVLHQEVYNDPKGHVILGTIIVILFLIQPLLGTWHHQRSKVNKTKPLLRYGHIWFGRFLIILGMIEGGLGLWLAANTPGGEKVYGALAGIIGVTYFALVIFCLIKDRKKGTHGMADASDAEKRNESSDGTERTS